jgi:hypothetical protein
VHAKDNDGLTCSPLVRASVCVSAHGLERHNGAACPCGPIHTRARPHTQSLWLFLVRIHSRARTPTHTHTHARTHTQMHTPRTKRSAALAAVIFGSRLHGRDTPLHRAADSCNYFLAQLVANGADVNARAAGTTAVVKLLLAHGADVNATAGGEPAGCGTHTQWEQSGHASRPSTLSLQTDINSTHKHTQAALTHGNVHTRRKGCAPRSHAARADGLRCFVFARSAAWSRREARTIHANTQMHANIDPSSPALYTLLKR